MNASLPLRIPSVGRGRAFGAFGLALAMHLLLLAMLLIGMRWQSHPPVAAQAELWSAPPPPLPREPIATPPAPARPEVVRPAPEPPARPTPAAPDPDIALQARKREKERLERERLEQETAARRKAEAAAKEAQARREAQAAREAQAKRDAQAQRDAQEQKLAQARAKQEAQARQETLAKQREEAKKAEQARRAAEAQAEAAAQERGRDAHVKRLLEQAGSGDKPARVGAAVGADAGGASGAAMGSWGSKVSSHIRANTVFQIPPELRGNPKAEFVVSLLPDGTIANLRLVRSSGVPAWDQAAERAIRRSDPLPRPPVGAPRDITIVQGPRDE